ncbi:MAG: PIN domain-containing protein [Flavobacteriales bacterium]
MLGFKGLSASDKKKISLILDDINIVDINSKIKQKTISIRSESNLKLPDSIITDTASFLNHTLFTADKEFKKVKNLSLLFYEDS